MDHDRLFKQLLTTFFVEFVELFLPEVNEYLERESIEFLDKEVFTDLTGGERHEVDLIVRARFQGLDTFFLIHVENQATKQPEFGQRMFGYFARLHEKFNLPVYPVALLSYGSPVAPEPDEYEIAFPDRRVLWFSFRTIQLNRLNWKDYLRQPNPVAAALMAKMSIAEQDRPKVKLECLRMIATLKLDPARSALVGGFMESYLILTAAEDAVYNEAIAATHPAEKRQILETIGYLSRSELRTRLIRIATQNLERRFGPLPPDTAKAIVLMPLETLEELTMHVLVFRDMGEAVAWVEAHPEQG